MKRITTILLLLLCTGCSDPIWRTGTELVMREQSENTVGVVWDDATSVSEYRVYLDGELVQTHPPGVTEALLRDLPEASTFLLEVTAANLFGSESEKLVLQVQTADRTAPVFPEDATLEVEVGFNIVLRWPEATDAFGPLRYIVRDTDSEIEFSSRRSEPWSAHGDLDYTRIEVLAVDPSDNESEPLTIEWTEEEFEAMHERRRRLEREHIEGLGPLDKDAILGGELPEGGDPLVLRRWLREQAMQAVERGRPR